MNVSKIIVGILAAALAGSSFAVGENGAGEASKLAVAKAGDSGKGNHGLSKKHKRKIKRAARQHPRAAKAVKLHAAQEHPAAAAVHKMRSSDDTKRPEVLGGGERKLDMGPRS